MHARSQAVEVRQGNNQHTEDHNNIRTLSGGTGSEYLLKTGRWQKTWILSKACVEMTKVLIL